MKRDFEDIDEIQKRIQTIPPELPVLPVRDAVIFPHAVIPLTVGRESSVRLINDVQQGDGMLVVLTQRDKRVDAPGPGDLYDVGTVSMVHRVMKTPEGNLFVIIMGVARTKVRDFHQFDPYLRANIEPMSDEREDEIVVDFQALRRTVVSQFERIIKLSPQLPDDLQTIVINIEDSSRLADYVATNLPNLSIVAKQFVLEQASVRKRFEFLNTELAKELEVLELRSKIQTQVQEEVGKSSASISFVNSFVRSSASLVSRMTISAKLRNCVKRSKPPPCPRRRARKQIANYRGCPECRLLPRNTQ